MSKKFGSKLEDLMDATFKQLMNCDECVEKVRELKEIVVAIRTKYEDILYLRAGIIDDKNRVEEVAKEYHEMCRELVNNQVGMITKPTRPYIEWDDLTDEMKQGRFFIAEKLIKKYGL